MEWLWLVWCFAGLILASIVYLLDNYFIEEIFHNEYESGIISSVFNIIPVGVMSIFGLDVSLTFQAVVACLGGFLLALAYFFYFRCLFSLNDSSFLDIVWNLAVPVMLLMAWIFLGELLAAIQYAGIGLMLIGAIVLDVKKFHFKNGWKQYFFNLGGLIFFYSASNTLMRGVYLEKEIAFSNTFFFFCIGQFLFGVCLAFLAGKRVEMKAKLFPLVKKYFLVFFSAETLELAGAFCIQKAISTTTSLSLYSGMLATMGVVIVVVGSIFVAILKIPHPFFESKRDAGEEIWKNLKFGLNKKILATVLIVAGVVLL